MKEKFVEKKEAVRLRKKGYSLGEISQIVQISKASASLWCAGVVLSGRAKQRLKKRSEDGRLRSRETHSRKIREHLIEARSFAETTLSAISMNQSLASLLCAMLYWCEGEKSKNDGVLFFSNSDPDLISTYLSFLRKGFDIDEKKFRVCIHLHEYHDEKKQLQFWSRITNIPRSQFIRPYYKKHTGKRKHENYPGCASVRYHDVRIARQVQAIARTVLTK